MQSAVVGASRRKKKNDRDSVTKYHMLGPTGEVRHTRRCRCVSTCHGRVSNTAHIADTAAATAATTGITDTG